MCLCTVIISTRTRTHARNSRALFFLCCAQALLLVEPEYGPACVPVEREGGGAKVVCGRSPPLHCEARALRARRQAVLLRTRHPNKVGGLCVCVCACVCVCLWLCCVLPCDLPLFFVHGCCICCCHRNHILQAESQEEKDAWITSIQVGASSTCRLCVCVCVYECM